MVVNNEYPVSYKFDEKELDNIIGALQTPTMQAYLQSLEADCIVAAHEVNLAEKFGNDLHLRIVANEAYTQGQIHVLRKLRTLKKVVNTQTEQGDK